MNTRVILAGGEPVPFSLYLAEDLGIPCTVLISNFNELVYDQPLSLFKFEQVSVGRSNVKPPLFAHNRRDTPSFEVLTRGRLFSIAAFCTSAR